MSESASATASTSSVTSMLIVPLRGRPLDLSPLRLEVAAAAAALNLSGTPPALAEGNPMVASELEEGTIPGLVLPIPPPVPALPPFKAATAAAWAVCASAKAATVDGAAAEVLKGQLDEKRVAGAESVEWVEDGLDEPEDDGKEEDGLTL